MKEELQGKLVEILTGIQTAVGKASDFAMDQIPDIAMQYVAWGRAWSIVDTALCIGVMVLGIWWFTFIRKKDWRLYDDALPFFSYVGAIIVSGFGFFCATSTLKTALLVWLAPKVWLLKELATIIK